MLYRELEVLRVCVSCDIGCIWSRTCHQPPTSPFHIPSHPLQWLRNWSIDVSIISQVYSLVSFLLCLSLKSKIHLKQNINLSTRKAPCGGAILRRPSKPQQTRWRHIKTLCSKCEPSEYSRWTRKGKQAAPMDGVSSRRTRHGMFCAAELRVGWNSAR